MGEIMNFPETFDEFAESYKIVDDKEVYTNGTELIPIFRVRQWLMRPPTKTKSEVEAEAIKEFAERLKDKLINTPFSVCCSGKSEDYMDGVLRGLVAKQNNVIDMINDLLNEMVGEKNV